MRPEIDGLRAIAVASVLLFHAGFDAFGGGFIGVDIFFVISGFLMTAIILREIDAEEFSVLRFYERRARRILPALFVVILACIPPALLLMLPYQLIDFGQSVVATMLFVSNMLFLFESSYFAPEATLKPLLHTWTLGVEEQFYIVLPVILIFLSGFGRWKLKLALAALCLCSLVFAEILVRISSTAAFFFAPARVWEMLIGALIATAPQLRHRVGRPAGEALALVGLALVAGSIVLLDGRFPYPSLYTLAPCAGAGLLILFAAPHTLVGRLLTLRPMMGLGLISYSAYLWHQPMFSYAKMVLGAPPSAALSAALLAATLGLAALSWRFVEQPMRARTALPGRRIGYAAVGGSLAFMAFGAVLVAKDGLVDRYPPGAREFALLNPMDEGRYIRAAFRILEDRPFDSDPATPNVLIIGDSYAQDFVNMALENDYLSGASASAFHIPAHCGVVLRPGGHEDLIAPADRAACARLRGVADISDRIAAADVVILVASWRDWVVDVLPETIAQLRALGPERVVVVSRKSFGPILLRDYLDMPAAERLAVRNPPPEDLAAQTARLRETLPDGVLVDFAATACDGGPCPVFAEDGALISLDGWHLTRDGAAAIGRKLFAHTALAGLR